VCNVSFTNGSEASLTEICIFLVPNPGNHLAFNPQTTSSFRVLPRRWGFPLMDQTQSDMTLNQQ
jgi:hypothetical protein